MQLVYFWATRADHELDAEHAEMVADMRKLAEDIDEFVEWRGCDDDLTYWGVVLFETEDSALQWKNHPRHNEIHQRGEARVYTSFGTRVFDLVRQAEWERA